ncbi:MAG TPA: hypothetical protein VKM72_08125 [Thermoanaerobaculia bacterium]|nr:hypothetical protein [Thermoanaerobaculia bacterium]
MIDRRGAGRWYYYMQIRLRHGLPVLPILVILRGGPPGLRRAGLREGFGGKATAVFRYRMLGLSGCQAEEWLSRPEPVAWAFAALMRPGDWSRAELKLECLRRIAVSEMTGLRNQILVNWVETYVQLSGQDAAELQRLLDLEGNEEIKAMELTWLGKAEARGMETGLETATQQLPHGARRWTFGSTVSTFGSCSSTLGSDRAEIGSDRFHSGSNRADPPWGGSFSPEVGSLAPWGGVARPAEVPKVTRRAFRHLLCLWIGIFPAPLFPTDNALSGSCTYWKPDWSLFASEQTPARRPESAVSGTLSRCGL